MTEPVTTPSGQTTGPWTYIAVEPEYAEHEVEAFRIQTQGPTHPDLAMVFHRDEKGESEANARLIAAAPELLDALKALTSNPSMNLSDAIYYVRDREGLGWDGPDVVAWSEALKKAEKAISMATPLPT